jgi:hypothetical protein
VPSISSITGVLLGLLRSDAGVPRTVAELAATESMELPPIPPAQFVAGNLAPDLADKTHGARYPQLCVYCEKLCNRQREKFRRFSGTAEMVVDVRVSQDRSDGMEQKLQLYVEAVTKVLEESKGDWSEGVSYGGGYEVTFGGARLGGKNFVQCAKIALELLVSQE